MFIKSEKHNANYLAKLVEITNIRKHPKADRLQVVTIDGCDIITGMDAKLGDIVVYFPIESAINLDFLKETNSFEDKSLNADPEAKGFFNSKGRVRAVKLRGNPSMGYIVPAQTLTQWLSAHTGEYITLPKVGTEFDCYKAKNKEVRINKKYVNYAAIKQDKREKQIKQAKYKAQQQSRLVDNQFRLHCDTAPLAKNLTKVNPSDLISITAKLHGTSVVCSNVLTRKQLKWYERFLIKCGINVATTIYDSVYSSRKVIKNKTFNDKKVSDGYYGTDIWGLVNKEIKDLIPAGMSVYGEIVGFLPDGKQIQKGYDYGCNPTEHKLYIYRITHTNANGQVFEYSTPQIIEWCKEKGLNHVPLYYHGFAGNLYNNPIDEHWHDTFLEKLKENYLEGDDILCKNKVPDEGICLRKENLIFDCFKYKSFRFFERETLLLDSEEVDIESQEAEE